MKKITLLSILLASACVSQIASADTLAEWTFESSIPTTAGPLAAEVGTGSALGYHAGAAAYSNPVGNGSVESFSSSFWAIGDYYQFSVGSLGYQGLGISFDQVSSSTGPGQFYVAYSSDGYSSDGLTFTQFGSTYAVLTNSGPNAWSSGAAITATSYTFNLSSIAALDNSAAIYFRLVDASTVAANGATVLTTGTSRVDNFVITASPVPEPSPMALVGGFGLLGLVMAARRRNG
jgi:hypothetical protein